MAHRWLYKITNLFHKFLLWTQRISSFNTTHEVLTAIPWWTDANSRYQFQLIRMLLYAVLYWPGHEIPGFTKKSCVAVAGSWGGRKSSAHNGHSVIGLGYKTGLRFLSTAVSMKGVSLPQRVSSCHSSDRKGGFVLCDFSLLLSLG